MLAPKCDEYYNQCENNKVKWPCLGNFLFKLLPFMCETFVQDRISQTPVRPTHDTSLCLINVFPRLMAWDNDQ